MCGRILITAGLLGALACAQNHPAPDAAVHTIGSATMSADGTLVLTLRAESGGAVGDGQVTYRPGDPNYASVIDHLGGIKPGETKAVPAWDEPNH